MCFNGISTPSSSRRQGLSVGPQRLRVLQRHLDAFEFETGRTLRRRENKVESQRHLDAFELETSRSPC